VATATDCTLLETSCEADAASPEVRPVTSAVEVRVLAAASSSVEDDESEPTSSPISFSKSRVMASTRWPRAILASASAAAASSAAFLAIRASLNTCRVSAMAPISVFSPWCGMTAVRSPSPSAFIGETIEAMPRDTSRTR
jgi:hypothetical protein